MELTDFDFVEHIRKPFSVFAVRVTKQNMEDIAPFVGEIEILDGKKFIQADRHKCQSSLKVWPGYYVTKHGKKVRVFSRKAFEEQFHPMGEDVAPWVEYLNGAPPVVETTKAKAVEADREQLSPAEEASLDEAIASVEAGEVEPLDLDAVEAIAETPEPVVIRACSHGTPEGIECAYKPCDGPED